MTPAARPDDPQDLAGRLDPEGLAMLMEKGLQDVRRRSTSVWAKNARVRLQELIGTVQFFNLALRRLNALTFRRVGKHWWSQQLFDSYTLRTAIRAPDPRHSYSLSIHWLDMADGAGQN